MWQGGVFRTKFFPQRVKGFLWFPLTGNDSKCPIRNFLSAGKPFIRPRKENSSGKAALYNAVDMPTQHLSLLILRMPDGIHAELTQDKRSLAGQILQTQQIALEITLIVQVNVETAKIDVLR